MRVIVNMPDDERNPNQEIEVFVTDDLSREHILNLLEAVVDHAKTIWR